MLERRGNRRRIRAPEGPDRARSICEDQQVLTSETIATTTLPDGGKMSLLHRGTEWLILVDGVVLMASRRHDSEEALASEAFGLVPHAKSVLVGGLGMGYTLRAVLDRLPADGHVVVAELVEALIDWNRSHLGQLSDFPLDDSRCEASSIDVYQAIAQKSQAYDLILLDVDNGPSALTTEDNRRLYRESGIRACRAALKNRGVLAVWSAGPSPEYERLLRQSGFQPSAKRVSAFGKSRSRHLLYLAQKTS
jgi:spermidine synthase